jgi:hypothetical protein
VPNLYTVLEEVEQDLCKILTTAFDRATFGPLRKIYIGGIEEGTTAKSLPCAAIYLPSWSESEDDDTTICSESANLNYEIYLHAAKPRGVTIEGEKRRRAQELRSAVKAGTLRHVSLRLPTGDTYEAQDDFKVEAIADSYVIRVNFRFRVEWTD